MSAQARRRRRVLPETVPSTELWTDLLAPWLARVARLACTEDEVGPELFMVACALAQHCDGRDATVDVMRVRVGHTATWDGAVALLVARGFLAPAHPDRCAIVVPVRYPVVVPPPRP